jgi:RHS repeat-associated protein
MKDNNLANNPNTPDTKYQYNGKEFNSDFGLNLLDYGARYYDPTIGRFISPDPLSSLAPGWTPYRYGFNNPIIYTDPTGMFESKDEAKQYAKDNGIKTGLFRNNKIAKQSDGSYAIENKKEHSSIANDKDFGVMTSALVTADRPSRYANYNFSESETMRNIKGFPAVASNAIPEKVGVSLATSSHAGVGTSNSLDLTWITKGQDASIVPYVTTTTGFQAGTRASADATISFQAGYYINSNRAKGNMKGGLLGWSAYGNASAGFVAGGTVGGSLGFSGKPFSSPTWAAGSIGGGASIGGGVSGGLSYTHPLLPSQFK